MQIPRELAFPETFSPLEVPYELFSEEHELLRKSLRSFVEKELQPNAEAWEEKEDFPRELFLRFGELGYHGFLFPEEYGGTGPDYIAETVLIEELSRAGTAGTMADLGAHRSLASLYVYNFGSEDQRRQWLVPALKGELLGCLGVTEPGAGSDVANIKTSAIRDGDSYILNGSKIFITNGAWCDFAVIAAKTDPEAGNHGISLFIVPAETDGFEKRRMKMLGWRTSHTGEFSFQDVRIPVENLLGEENRGFYQIMQNFQWERLAMALGQTAGAQRTYEYAKRFALQRRAFGREIGHFQVWRHRFAELASEIEMSRALTYHALRLFLHGITCIREVSMAKYYSSELGFRVADECVQVHGGYGYMMEFAAQRAWRDSRLGPIGGGTTEIMKDVIARTYGL